MRHTAKRSLALVAMAALGAVVSIVPASASDPLRPGVSFFDYAHDPATPSPPRRYLTTYMAKYPFGVLREDYTPLGAPGVSKAAYYGSPRMFATLHALPRQHHRRVASNNVLRVRY